LAEHPVL